MDQDLDGVLAFVSAINGGTFSRAARELGVTPSAISKRVARLEDRLGVTLINRTTRKLSLTDAGLEFYQTCARGLSDIAEAELRLSRLRDHAQGVLRVNVPQGFGRSIIAPLVPHFLARHPGVHIDLLFGPLSRHLFDERVDVLISSVDPPDSSLIVRPLMAVERVACATPDYLKRCGRPETLQELARHNCLIFTNATAPNHEWVFSTAEGRKRIRIAGNYQTNSHEALVIAVTSGLGIAQIPAYIVEPALRSGELVTVFRDELTPDQRAVGDTMNAYYPHAKNRLPKVKVFIDFLTDHFSAGGATEASSARGAPAP